MRAFICIFFLVISFATSADEINHKVWDELLKKYVSLTTDKKSTVVDYQGFLDDRQKLTQYLNNVSSVKKITFESWDKNTQLAFLINTYNAFTIDYILTKWPSIQSIKELGGFFSSPWSKKIIPLFDDLYSLDNIEHDFIRGTESFSEPRIHFAVNCASIGCPALRPEAYMGEKLSTQLEEQTILFLSDTSRNYLSKNTLKVSPIFKWYKKDFTSGWNNLYSLEEFLTHYSEALNLTDEEKNALLNRKIKIEFLGYDWQLNKK